MAARLSNLIDNLHYTIASSMDVRTTIYTVDTYNGFKARVNGGKEKATAIRSHFAVLLQRAMVRKKMRTEKRA